MNFLKNSHSVLSHLLRQKPAVCTPPAAAQAPGSRCFHTFRIIRHSPVHSSPQSTHRRYQHTGAPRRKEIIPWITSRRGGSRWYEDKRVQALASLVAGGGAVAFFCCSKEVVPHTNRTRFIILSPNAELWIGKFVFEELKRELGSKILPPQDPDSVRVRRIASEIVRGVDRGLANSQHHVAGTIMLGVSPRKDAEADDRDERPGAQPPQTSSLLDGWEVIVVKDDRINAMCAPGGKIIVFTGLLDAFREDAEIATVLGHEVGHAVARHSAEKFTAKLLLLILQFIILQFIDMPDTVEGMSKFLVTLPLSRRMEMEADHVGLMLLAAAGYDPRVAPSVYEKLGDREGDSALKNHTSTHPSCKKRSQVLSQEHIMNEALELYWEVRAGQGTDEGFPLDSGTQLVTDGGK